MRDPCMFHHQRLCPLVCKPVCKSHAWHVLCLVTESCLTLCNPMDCSPPGSIVHGDSPGTNTGVGCRALLQGIFLAQGLNPGLPHCWWILYQLSHKGSPYTKVRVKCLCPVGGERRVSSLLGFLKNLFKIHAGKNKYIKFTQEVAGAEDRGGEERSRQ